MPEGGQEGAMRIVIEIQADAHAVACRPARQRG
jgi:hypothetical protein